MSFRPTAIVLHCSASQWGDAEAIRDWHASGNGWSDIGYHYVVLNGRRASRLAFDPELNGVVEPGRREGVAGAHCKARGMNSISLGVCVIGSPGFKPAGVPIAPAWCFQGLTKPRREQIAYCSTAQIAAVIRLCADLCSRYGIAVSAITQHSDHEPGKPLCASLSTDYIRQRVREEMR